MRYIKYTISVASLLFLILPQTGVFSQTLSSDIQKSFTISHSPMYPSPNETVNARIISYAFDVDRSYITWILNGEIVSQGKGQKRFEFNNGSLGETTSLSVSIITVDGLSTSQEIRFKAMDLDLLWEADTHVPVFYKGKAVPVSDSVVKITAIPQGFDDPKNLIYRWERDYTYVSDASGFGKNTYSIRFTDMFPSEIIGVTVTDEQNLQIFQKNIKIKKHSPEVLFYREDPLEGPTYQKTLVDDLQLMGESEVVIRSEPYFFPNDSFFDLSRVWKMNNSIIEPFSNPNFIGLTVPQNTKGEASLQLEINNPTCFFQTAKKLIKLIF